MSGSDFWYTVAGRIFLEGTVPKLIEAVERLATAITQTTEGEIVMEEINAKGINLIGKNYLVKEGSVVKIRTIKAKHIQQMENYNPIQEDNLLEKPITIVGRTEHSIIFVEDTTVGNFRKIMIPDYIMLLATKGNKKEQEARDFVKGLPQLFVE